MNINAKILELKPNQNFTCGNPTEVTRKRHFGKIEVEKPRIIGGMKNLF